MFSKAVKPLTSPDPTREYLAMPFPRGFGHDATLFYGLEIAGMTVILGGVTGRYPLFTRSAEPGEFYIFDNQWHNPR